LAPGAGALRGAPGSDPAADGADEQAPDQRFRPGLAQQVGPIF
jgi:hypothetical protein